MRVTVSRHWPEGLCGRFQFRSFFQSLKSFGRKQIDRVLMRTKIVLL